MKMTIVTAIRRWLNSYLDFGRLMGVTIKRRTPRYSCWRHAGMRPHPFSGSESDSPRAGCCRRNRTASRRPQPSCHRPSVSAGRAAGTVRSARAARFELVQAHVPTVDERQHVRGDIRVEMAGRLGRVEIAAHRENRQQVTLGGIANLRIAPGQRPEVPREMGPVLAVTSPATKPPANCCTWPCATSKRIGRCHLLPGGKQPISSPFCSASGSPPPSAEIFNRPQHTKFLTPPCFSNTNLVVSCRS